MINLQKNILPMIESVYDDFSQIEKKIAQYFLYDYQESDDLSAFALAKKIKVSIPSLTRFAKKCGYQGFRQFIYEFKSKAVVEQQFSSDLTRKVLADYAEIMNKTYSLVDEEKILRVAKMLKKASRVYIYGVGSSGLVAREIEFRFMRLGVNCVAITEDHMMRMSSVMVNENTMILALSLSGNTKVVIQALSNAKRLGAKTVLFTSNNKERLRYLSDELVLVAMKDHLERGNNISPQFPMFLLVDIMYYFFVDLDPENHERYFVNSLAVLEDK